MGILRPNFHLVHTLNLFRSKIDHEQVSDIVGRGRDLFVAHYHEDADPVQSILDDIHPDLGEYESCVRY